MQVYIALCIFVVTYTLIVSEKVHQTLAVILGGVLMVILGILNEADAVTAIDFNTIGLLIGMMITVEIVKETGLFQYLAIRTAKLARGNPKLILIYLSIVTAVASAFLDNVTTILIILPLVLVIADTLDLKLIPFLMSQIIIANIGGTATLIGDPPNILIGSATGLGFNDFLINMAPVSIFIAITTIGLLCFIYRKDLVQTEEASKRLAQFDARKILGDMKMVKRSIFVLSLIMLGFILHKPLHIEVSTIALGGASLLMLLTKNNVSLTLEKVEWATIYFIIGMFILVSGLEKVGVITYLADKVILFSQGNMQILSVILIWFGGIASAFLGNIPFVVTMIPMFKQIIASSNIINPNPLWWALALGCCLGGNGTMFGSAANVAAIGIYRSSSKKFSWLEYFVVAFPITIFTLVIATAYILIFQL